MPRANLPSWRRELTFSLAASAVLALDQLAKLWVRANLAPGESLPPDGLLRLTHITNTGGAFGLLGNQTFLLTITSLIIVVVLLTYYRRLPLTGLWARIALGLILGGAVGNLIDRLRFGYVTDFIDLRVWPVFNLADSAIVGGVALLAYLLLFPARKGERRA